MEVARAFAERSTCSRAKVGAVIALNGRVLSTGYNGAPAGMPHCSHPCTCDDLHLETDTGHLVECLSTQPCNVTIHAEANAVAFAARHGVATDGAEVYVTLSPCLMCAKLLVNAGISKVWMEELYRERSGIEYLEKAGIVTALLR